MELGEAAHRFRSESGHALGTECEQWHMARRGTKAQLSPFEPYSRSGHHHVSVRAET
jgi:hypothetical protein